VCANRVTDESPEPWNEPEPACGGEPGIWQLRDRGFVLNVDLLDSLPILTTRNLVTVNLLGPRW
jgi:hypothetical protein